MHELSIAMNILEIVEDYTSRENTKKVLELELDIGDLLGIEIPALKFALETTKEGSILESSVIVINAIQAQVQCQDCQSVFTAKTQFEPCPECQSFFSIIQSGNELKVKSILIE